MSSLVRARVDADRCRGEVRSPVVLFYPSRLAKSDRSSVGRRLRSAIGEQTSRKECNRVLNSTVWCSVRVCDRSAGAECRWRREVGLVGRVSIRVDESKLAERCGAMRAIGAKRGPFLPPC